MAQREALPTLAERIKAVFANILIFYIALMWASGNPLPTGGLESVWFLSGTALWFFSLLSAPYFVPPRDAIANAIAAACILVTADLTVAAALKEPLEIVRWLALIYCVLVTGLALTALFLHDRDRSSPVGRLCYRLTAVLGLGEILYTPSAIISIVGAYQQSLMTIACLLMLWTMFMIARPAELALLALRRWREDAASSDLEAPVGIIERIDYPNILRVRLARGAVWKPGAVYVAAMSNGDHYIIALFAQIQGAEIMGTGLCVAPAIGEAALGPGLVASSADQTKAAALIESLSGATDAELIGFTVENSNIGTLRFEVAASQELGEGQVVFVRLNGRDVFYQILDAHTAEESFDQNPHGRQVAVAAQLGCFDATRGFTKFDWLSGMNAPVFWAKSREFPAPVLSDRDFIIGNVPSTTIRVAANLDDLVDYHAAILGMTGTGKTELALDIAREAVRRGVKVFCVDFTGEYRARLADLNPLFPALEAKEVSELETRLFAVETGKYGAPDEKKALQETLTHIRASIEKQVVSFLTGDDHQPAVLELLEIANTKASLRLTEHYLSAVMEWARDHRQARRIMILLEEAHTIIPEPFGSGFDYDTQWVVSRIGQIALQGRKYGVGLLVVCQRTALVSKTILSQCNTFLTHALIDQTSLQFLQSVYSAEHTSAIPNLGRFEFLASGRAIRAERPILLQRPFDQSKKDASDALRRPLANAAVPPKSDIVLPVDAVAHDIPTPDVEPPRRPQTR